MCFGILKTTIAAFCFEDVMVIFALTGKLLCFQMNRFGRQLVLWYLKVFFFFFRVFKFFFRSFVYETFAMNLSMKHLIRFRLMFHQIRRQQLNKCLFVQDRSFHMHNCLNQRTRVTKKDTNHFSKTEILEIYKSTFKGWFFFLCLN